MEGKKELTFSEDPHPKCKATKAELLQGGRYQVWDHCPLCEESGIFCKVGRHPIGAHTKDQNLLHEQELLPAAVAGVISQQLEVFFDEKIKPMSKAVNLLFDAVPVSRTTDRSRHQKQFKEDLRARYQCIDSNNPNVTRCMLLDRFFSTEDVIASHIVALKEDRLCVALGIGSVWDPRNGLLLHKAIDRKFEAMDVTFLPNPEDSIIYMRVLYDSVLDEEIGVSRKHLGLPGKGNVTFRDLQNRPLIIPPLTWPFRRVLVRHANSAYKRALNSSAPHEVAEQTAPDEAGWDAIYKYLKGDLVSPQCSDLNYFND